MRNRIYARLFGWLLLLTVEAWQARALIERVVPPLFAYYQNRHPQPLQTPNLNPPYPHHTPYASQAPATPVEERNAYDILQYKEYGAGRPSISRQFSTSSIASAASAHSNRSTPAAGGSEPQFETPIRRTSRRLNYSKYVPPLVRAPTLPIPDMHSSGYSSPLSLSRTVSVENDNNLPFQSMHDKLLERSLTNRFYPPKRRGSVTEEVIRQQCLASFKSTQSNAGNSGRSSPVVSARPSLEQLPSVPELDGPAGRQSPTGSSKRKRSGSSQKRESRRRRDSTSGERKSPRRSHRTRRANSTNSNTGNELD